jgi:VIT1/CCC1 family predicted Fe2+/Mn2+ transporter
MAGTIHRIAQGIDDIRVAVWDEQGRLGKLLLLFLLIITGAAIPLVPIAFVARRLAR